MRFPTLSGGDKATYFSTVNHEKHNIDFFYALLVVSKNRGGEDRYTVKHFMFRRNDRSIYEIPHENVRVVDGPGLGHGTNEQAETRDRAPKAGPPGAPNAERAKDQEFFSEFYPDLKPLISKSTGAPYWKGPLSLIDGSRAEIVAAENLDGSTPSYSIATSSKNPLFTQVIAECQERTFRSARHAVLHFERGLNGALYRGGNRE